MEKRVLFVGMLFLSFLLVGIVENNCLLGECFNENIDSNIFWERSGSGQLISNGSVLIENEVKSDFEIAVIDEEPPEFGSDETTQTPSTGEGFTILLNATDNVEVEKVFLTYIFDNSTLTIESMNLDGDGLWKKTIMVPLDAWNVRYSFHIKDVSGNWSNTTLCSEITVTDIIAPVAVTGPNATIDQGDNITFNAVGSSDNRGIENYTWALNGEKKYGAEINFVFEIQEEHKIVLTVFDAAGNSHSDDLFVTVVDTITPIADAGENQTENQGTRIFFNATLSSDNIGIVDYKWSFKEGRYDRYLSGVTSSYTFDIPGKYIVTLKVTDKAGNAAKDNVTIDIVDTVPPRAFFKAKETWVNEGEPMIFDARNSWDNVAVTDWTWTIDSTELTGEKVSYTFDEAAFYSITLNVTDAAGNFDVLTYQYRVYGILGNDNGGGGTSIIGNASTQETDFSGCMIIVVALVVVLSIAAVVILLVLKKRTKMQGEILMAQPGDIALGTSTVNKLRAGTPTIDTQLFPMNPNPENIHQNGGFVFERNVMEQIKVDETKPIHDNSFFNETTEKEIPSSIRNMIPNYTLTHILRTGDFATVYRGKDSQGHDVAIKLPKLLDATLDSTIYDKFESETKIWKNLKHKNIVNLYGNGLDPIPYIVMELMQGGDLKQLMDHHRLGIKESVDIMQQILDGVSYAHRMASVHSDIKPENILFNAEGIAKISDWGVGKFMLSPSVTKTGEIEGNLQYLAPEHIHKSKFGAVDWISDIFQLGILFYEMLTGENPFFDDDPVGIMEKITDEETKPPSELNPDISKDLDSIILKALQKRKEDRWRSTDIMFDRLRRVAVKGLIESRPRK